MKYFKIKGLIQAVKPYFLLFLHLDNVEIISNSWSIQSITVLTLSAKSVISSLRGNVIVLTLSINQVFFPR